MNGKGCPLNQPLGSYWHLLGGAGVFQVGNLNHPKLLGTFIFIVDLTSRRFLEDLHDYWLQLHDQSHGGFTTKVIEKRANLASVQLLKFIRSP